MAIIVVKDLQENVDLDHAAMRAIVGGARWRAAPSAYGTPRRDTRIIKVASATVRKGDPGARPTRS